MPKPIYECQNTHIEIDDPHANPPAVPSGRTQQAHRAPIDVGATIASLSKIARLPALPAT